MLVLAKTLLLFVLTALAEITAAFCPTSGCAKGGLLASAAAAASLAVFAWLLTLHPAASGRVYAAYGCVYVVTALAWLRLVDKVHLSNTDMLGGAVALAGMLIIVSGWGGAS